ncbi:Origin recognition complex subunit 1 [Metarhizium anisopliae]|nr:Origin recognition complex subunit 1 [Metarhizium anisopliae]
MAPHNLTRRGPEPAVRRRKTLPGISREDSDDELGSDDLPWEWIYNVEDPERANHDAQNDRKRRKVMGTKIVGARMGTFECRIGDTVLLKADGSNEAWVGIICEFVEDDGEGDNAANFMWFSTEKEIRNKDKKRNDFYWVCLLPIRSRLSKEEYTNRSDKNELYISPSWDINPLASINGKAKVMSLEAFLSKYPSGKIPRQSKDYGKTFVCRRGCNTRTATYTEEFIWEEMYSSVDDMFKLIDFVEKNTKAARGRRKAREQSPQDTAYLPPQTPTKGSRTTITTPQSKRSHAEPGSRSQKRGTGKKLEFTPLAMRKLSPSAVQSSPFQIARSRLHVSSVPTSLPCREGEFSLVYSHLEAAITDGSGNCIYISGTPGTGKTATVREVISRLEDAVGSDELDDFIFVEINGMKITDPHQSYTLLWEALRGQRASPSQALDLLEREFNNPSPRRVPCVVLMDELDQLVTKNQAVMYNFFNWPTLRHSRLIVLAVANTMDLPERTLSNKISSRLGLTRITFPGYTHEQLMKIIQSRLEGVPGNVVDADAVQFASRKVAAVSGDARRALDICRRAVEIAEGDAQGDPMTPSKNGTQDLTRRGKVTIATIKKAINEATTNPVQQHLRGLPLMSKLVMAAVLFRIRRTGLAESTFGEILDELQRATAHSSPALPGMAQILDSGLQGTPGATHRHRGRPSYVHTAALDLAAAGLINIEAHRAERSSKLRLTIADDEVKMALRDDGDLRAMGLGV